MTLPPWPPPTDYIRPDSPVPTPDVIPHTPQAPNYITAKKNDLNKASMSSMESDTMSSSTDTNTNRNEEKCLPRLNYNLHTPRRHKKIAIFFILFFLEAGILPLILFYALRWGTHLSITTNLAIITSVVGTFSGYRFAMRMYYLWLAKSSPQWRPIGAGRWGVDASQLMFSLALFAFFVPLVIGSSLNPASPPTVSMALPALMITACLPLFITGLFELRIRVPIRVSSLPANEPLPPGVFTLVEDIIAVDGHGGLEFRKAWRARYEASAIMRKLLRDLSLFWGATGTVAGTAFIVVSWTTTDDIAIGIGYGLPWLWAIICAVISIKWTRRELKREREELGAHPQMVKRQLSLHIRDDKPEQQNV